MRRGPVATGPFQIAQIEVGRGDAPLIAPFLADDQRLLQQRLATFVIALGDGHSSQVRQWESDAPGFDLMLASGGLLGRSVIAQGELILSDLVEAVNFDTIATRHGPVSVTFGNSPTAVSLTDFGVDRGVPTAWLLLSVVVVTLSALAAARLRLR